MDPALKANQGYEPGVHFRCTIASMEEYPATAEYFGVWDIREDACEPLPCEDYPEDALGLLGAELPTGYSTATCGTKLLDDGNFSLPSGENCSITCAPGWEPDGTGVEADLFVCDRGIYSATAECKRRTCTYAGGEAGMAATFIDATVEFEGTLEVQCAP